jgi:acetyl-CoA acetyltransferase
MKLDDIDLFEVNEAFASVPSAGCSSSTPIRRSSTSTAARSRSAIRSAPRARS